MTAKHVGKSPYSKYEKHPYKYSETEQRLSSWYKGGSTKGTAGELAELKSKHEAAMQREAPLDPRRTNPPGLSVPFVDDEGTEWERREQAVFMGRRR